MDEFSILESPIFKAAVFEASLVSQAMCGWYGKLPMLGDFICKDLPDDFVKPWDQWLQEGMLEGRENLGQDWEEHYLTFPMWRFLWRGSANPGQYWAGLLMPSLDRVGRLFPFTIAACLGDSKQSLPRLQLIDQYLDQCQGLAQKLLEDDALEEFGAALLQLPGLLSAPTGEPALDIEQAPEQRLYNLEQEHGAIFMSSVGTLEATLASLALQELFSRGPTPCLWWQAPNAQQNGIVRASGAGLTPALFLDLVHGGA